MGWGWGWTGDCGCCEPDGPCDNVGVYNDDFASVNAKWVIGSTGSSFIDTGKPGLFLDAATPPVFLPAAQGARCQELPSSRSTFFVRTKAKILVDFSDAGFQASGPLNDQGIGLDHSIEDSALSNTALIARFYAIKSSGTLDDYIAWVPGLSEVPIGETPVPGDVLEIESEFTQTGTDTYSYDSLFYLNSNLEATISRTGFTIVADRRIRHRCRMNYRRPAYFASESCYFQDFRGSVTLT